MLAPIATVYAGTRFRSRTEARWAVLFDELEIRWEYERQGYELPVGWYLPDFWLREWDCFAEVKGGTEQWDDAALGKAESLCLESERPLLLLDELQVLNPCVRVLCSQYGDKRAGICSKWRCDMMHSILKGRVWYEFEGHVPEPDPDWAAACEAARSARFDS
jgi:hypothetical protein